MPPIAMSKTGIIGREENSQQSLLVAMNKFVQAVNEMDDTVMIPSRLKDMTLMPENYGTSMAAGCKQNAVIASDPRYQTDLFNFYTMLNAIKTELVRGPPREEAEPSEEGEQTGERTDDLARQSSQAFRHHLCGLFSVLKQMTDTATYLKTRYQEDIGEYTPPVAMPTFNTL